MRLTAFLSLLVALNTFLNPFFSAIGLSANQKARLKPIEFSPVSSSAMITGQSAGPTPFIAQINATVSPANSLKSVRFSVTPKPGSVTRPVSATYTSRYLQSRSYLNTSTGSVFVPVFGLYANFSNTVVLNFLFTDGSSQQNTVAVSTADWTDSCNVYKNSTVLQARTGSTTLSYDYIMIKNDCGSQSPVIIDTDGAVRQAIKWILGDPTKKWYQFASLRAYALRLARRIATSLVLHTLACHAQAKTEQAPLTNVPLIKRGTMPKK